MKHELPLTLEVNDDPGLMLKTELATIDDVDSPVSLVYAGFPAPIAYEFKSRSGRHYRVNLEPVIQSAIRKIGELEVDEDFERR